MAPVRKLIFAVTVLAALAALLLYALPRDHARRSAARSDAQAVADAGTVAKILAGYLPRLEQDIGIDPAQAGRFIRDNEPAYAERYDHDLVERVAGRPDSGKGPRLASCRFSSADQMRVVIRSATGKSYLVAIGRDGGGQYGRGDCLGFSAGKKLTTVRADAP